MKLTSKTEYALLAMMELARHHKKPPMHIHDIATRCEIPERFLEQILLHLKHGGFVKSKRGKEGGYEIAKDPNKISLAEIIRFFEGALAPSESVSKYFYAVTPLSHEKSILKLMKEIRDFIADKLEKTTLAVLIKA